MRRNAKQTGKTLRNDGNKNSLKNRLMTNKNLCERIQPQRTDAIDTKHAHIIHNSTTHNNTDLGRSYDGASNQNLSKLQVSLFENYENPYPKGIIILDDWLFLSQYQYIKEVKAIRAEIDKAKRRELKSKLPAVTPSGTFSYRSNSELIKHNGIICLDIDQKDNPGIGNFSAIIDTLIDFEGLYYTGLSVSGNGLFLLIRIAYPEKHSEHFNALASDLKERELIVDPQCKEVSRLRGASYDPNPYYNPLVTPYEKLLNHDALKPVSSTNIQDAGLTWHRVRILVEKIEQSRIDITNAYKDWYAIGRSLAAEFGENGREWYHLISRQSTKYKPQECEKQYNQCLQACSLTSIASFFYICKQHEIYAK